MSEFFSLEEEEEDYDYRYFTPCKFFKPIKTVGLTLEFASL